MKPWQIRQRQLGRRVTELRGDRTRTAFAKECGVARGVLYRAESGGHLISVTAAEKIDASCGTGGELVRMRRSVQDLKKQLSDVPPVPPAGALTDEQRGVVAAAAGSLGDAVRAVEAAAETVGDPDSPFTAVQVSRYQSRCRAAVEDLQCLVDDLVGMVERNTRT